MTVFDALVKLLPITKTATGQLRDLVTEQGWLKVKGFEVFLSHGSVRPKIHMWPITLLKLTLLPDAFVASAAFIGLINKGQSPTKDMTDVLRPTIVVDMRLRDGYLVVEVMDVADYKTIDEAYLAACKAGDAAQEAFAKCLQVAKNEPECQSIVQEARQHRDHTLEAVVHMRDLCRVRNVEAILKTLPAVKAYAVETTVASKKAINLVGYFAAHRTAKIVTKHFAKLHAAPASAPESEYIVRDDSDSDVSDSDNPYSVD